MAGFLDIYMMYKSTEEKKVKQLSYDYDHIFRLERA